MEEWKEYKLGDIAEFRTGKLNSNAAVENGKYPFFTCAPETYYINDYAFDQKAILLAGNNAEGNFNIKYYEGKFNAYQRTYVINPVSDAIDIHFLYYALQLCLQQFKSLSQGTSTKFLTAKILNAFCIQVPSLSIQKRIASIIKSLDDKIEVNRKINENLEQQAQALFKSWFIDFEPFKNGEFVESELGMIPKGWRVGHLGEFCNIFTGKKDVKQSIPIGLYPFFSCSPNHTYSNEYIYDGPSIIIAGNGSYTGRTSFFLGKFDLYQRTYACTIKEGFNEKIISFLYYMMKCLFEPVKMGGTRGSSIPYIVMNDIVLQKFALDNSLVEKYSDFAYNVMKQIQQNNQESRCLAELRDTLLPKLMSGELKVNDIH